MVRLMDVAAALSARRYERPGELVFAVTPPDVPALGDGGPAAGCYHLAADGDGVGRCRPTDAEPQLTISSRGLGALYLGYATPGRLDGLVARGDLAGSPAAIDTLRHLLAWPVAPWCNEIF